MNYVQYIKTKDITKCSNDVVKKVRNNCKLMYMLDVNKNKSELIRMLIDSTYEIIYFHSICTLLKVIGENESIKESWERADKFMYAFTEEFNSDRKLYEKIIELTAINTDKNIKLFLDILIIGMKKYGTHLDYDVSVNIMKVKNKIIKIREKILYIIWNGGVLRYTDKLEPLCNLVVTTTKNEKVVQMTKTTHNYIMKNIESSDVRKYIDKSYSSYCADNVLTLFSDLLLFRYNYARLLGYKNFFECQISNCMLKDSSIIMSKITAMTVKLRDEFLKDDFYKKHLTDVIYEHEQIRKKLNKEIGTFHISSVTIFIFKIIEEMFGVEFKTCKLPTWVTDMETCYIIEGDEVLGYLFIDLMARKNKSNKTSCICFSPYGLYPYVDGIINKPMVAITGGIKDKNLVSFEEVVSIAHEFGHLIHILSKRNNFALLNDIRTEIDFVEIPSYIIENCIWDVDNIKRLIRYELVFGKVNKPMSIVEDITKLRNHCFGFNLLQNCIVSAFDQYIHSSVDFIKLLINNKDTSSKKINETFKIIYKNAIDTQINCITPSTLITMTNGNECLTHCKIISETIAFNLWNKYKNDKNFFKYFRKNVLKNTSENSFELLNKYSSIKMEKSSIEIENSPIKIEKRTINEESESRLKIIFESNACDSEDTFHINKN